MTNQFADFPLWPKFSAYGLATVLNMNYCLKIKHTVCSGRLLVQVRNTDLDFLFAVLRPSFIVVEFYLS